MPKQVADVESMTLGPNAADNSSGRIPMEKDRVFGGAALGAQREGGVLGGGVSAPETLPSLYPMGVGLSGKMGKEGMGGDYLEGPGRNPADPMGNKHGLDGGHERAGKEMGRIHSMGEARGGHYHCMAEGCSYKTRDKSHGLKHATIKNSKHGISAMGGEQSRAYPSSPSSGSSPAHGTGPKKAKFMELRDEKSSSY